MAVAGGLVLGVFLSTLGVTVWQHTLVDAQAERISKIRESRDERSARVDAILADARNLAARLPASAPTGIGPAADDATGDVAALRAIVQRLAARRDVLDMRVAQASAQRERERAALQRLRRREADLEAELAETRDSLRAVSSGRENLGDRLAETLADLHRARARYQAVAGQHDDSQDRIETLSSKLDRVSARKTALKRKVTRLETKLASATSERDALLAERKELANRVGRLERTLGHVADAEKTDLIARIGNLEKSLVTAERTATNYRQRTEELERKVASLKQRLTNVRRTQSGLFDHYTSQARTSLDAIEKTVAMTGLDVDRLIEKARPSDTARGGPFVPAAGMMAAVAKPARKLDRQMERLRLLQNVLSRLPLTPPLDSYWVSSHFGKRRDPYNGRWAMHEGLDLAGQPGLAVQAAAPGTVVSAGWEGGYGRMVEIDHGYGITTRYGHLKSVAVDAGEDVDHRAKLGKVGNTGRSTGPHVHYEVRVDGEPVDPMNFLKAGKHAFKG
jgi:murein DD-endopeptidase MepM/ murein hydrolase activator NlpD